MKTNSLVKQRQLPLIETYLDNPKNAWITDVAFVEGKDFDKPFNTSVYINDELQENFKIGVHRALGGYHDMPNPGDMLCATLASCFESTLRMIAERLGIQLEYTFVKAEAHVDVRGTLMVNRNVPVAFQSIDLNVNVRTVNESSRLPLLLKATENSCVIFQTLKLAIPVRIHHHNLVQQSA